MHPISLHYKTPIFKKLLNKISDSPTDVSLSTEENDHIEANLTHIFEFLNVNLEILTDQLEESFSMRIVHGIWKQFLETSESMIVPSLEDDKQRKPWDDKRIQFFTQYIHAAKLFFQPGEGEGLSTQQIECDAYIQLQLILQHYENNKRELMEMYCSLTKNLQAYDGPTMNLDWILKLLKMRGMNDFVVLELKNRCLQQSHQTDV